MKGTFGILLVIAVMCPLGSNARGVQAVDNGSDAGCGKVAAGVATLADRLDSTARFAADASYEVSLAMSDDEVAYRLRLASEAAPADTLFGADYLIDWKLERHGDVSDGFLAYFDGHCYRYRDHRLQEYHFEWDSIPFQTRGGGVQATGQFVELLPKMIARELRSMLADSTFTVKFTPSGMLGGREAGVVEATQEVGGYVGRNYTLHFDVKSGLPLQIYNEYNPGRVSEQSVKVTYTYPASDAALAAVDAEEKLMSVYPEVFEKYRESNYRIENIRGLPLPAFSLPTPTGERYTHQKKAPFRAPTVVALLDASTAAAAPTVSALRKAQRSMPRQVDLVLAFVGSNADAIEGVAGALEPGEAHLMSARTLARDCGTSVFPTVLIVDSNGIVADVALGFNNSLAQDVIQSLALVD